MSNSIMNIRPLRSEGLVGIELMLSLLALQELATVNEEVFKVCNSTEVINIREEYALTNMFVETKNKRQMLRIMFSLDDEEHRISDMLIEELYAFTEEVAKLSTFVFKLVKDVPSRQLVEKELFGY